MCDCAHRNSPRSALAQRLEERVLVPLPTLAGRRLAKGRGHETWYQGRRLSSAILRDLDREDLGALELRCQELDHLPQFRRDPVGYEHHADASCLQIRLDGLPERLLAAVGSEKRSVAHRHPATAGIAPAGPPSTTARSPRNDLPAVPASSGTSTFFELKKASAFYGGQYCAAVRSGARPARTQHKSASQQTICSEIRADSR